MFIGSKKDNQAALPVLIIPAYQPLEKLPSIIDELLKENYPEILVVNDGSDEEKRALFNAIGQKERVTVLTHAVNLGKGMALKTAFNYSLVNRPSGGVVTVDADGQHLPADVLKVAEAFQKNPNALVLGVRGFKSEVPLRSRFGNELTKHIFHVLLGKKLQDTQTGLRGISASFMRDLMRLKATRYEFELDMLIAAVRKQISIQQVPISTVYEDGNKSSHFNPLLDSFRIYFVLLRFAFWSLITYISDLIVFTSVHQLTNDVASSFVAGRTVGLCVSILGMKLFVFKSNKKFFEVVPKIFLLWLGLLAISSVMMQWLTSVQSVNVYVSRITVDSLLFLFNFLVQRHVIFSGSRSTEPDLLEEED